MQPWVCPRTAPRLSRGDDPQGALAIYQNIRQRRPDFIPALLAEARLLARDPARLDQATSLALEARQKAGPSPEVQSLLAEIEASRVAEEEKQKSEEAPETPEP